MRKSIVISLILSGLVLGILSVTQGQTPGKWSIPAGGNSYLVKQDAEAGRKKEQWQSASDYYLFFFHSDRPCEVNIALNIGVDSGASRLKVTIGSKDFKVKASGKETHLVKIGKAKLDSGYTRVEIHGLQKEGSIFAALNSLEVASKTPGLVLSYVKDNIDNRFYWGRRGPSVHLNYELPEGAEVEYFHNELTVPIGQDPIGSYFMANGFGEGYFGMQVNGPEERRLLFSVWSPYRTDKPGDIPESDRIVLLAKGEGVHAGEFGNEGSGGQSYLKYPWKAGVTYRFLLKGTP